MNIRFRAIHYVAAALALATLSGISGCATTPDTQPEHLPFTDSLIRDYGLTDAHKRRLQYYVSSPVTLARSSANSLRGIADGKLIERGNTQLRGINISSGTPGVVVGSGANWLAVSFEPGSYLYFVSNQAHVNSPYWNDERDGDRYYLYAPDWDGRAGTVRVGNTDYQAIDSSIDAYLTIDRESFYSDDSSGRVLSGRWLDGRPRPF